MLGAAVPLWQFIYCLLGNNLDVIHVGYHIVLDDDCLDIATNVDFTMRMRCYNECSIPK
jgi:hypothetical protein